MKCKHCNRHPEEIKEYQLMVEDGEYPDEEMAVMLNEGTYNPVTDLFYCTECYIKLGCPKGQA